MSLSAAVGSWDIYVSSLFYDGGHFLLEDNFLGNLIRRGIPELIVLSAAVIFAVWLYGKISCRVYGGIDSRGNHAGWTFFDCERHFQNVLGTGAAAGY